MRQTTSALSVAVLTLALQLPAVAKPPSSPPVDETTSSGTPQGMTPTTRIQYFSPTRTWYSEAGDLMVCPAPAETYLNASKRCHVQGTADVRGGWVFLQDYGRPGYALNAVQVNETKNGPSLVLYWRPITRSKS